MPEPLQPPIGFYKAIIFDMDGVIVDSEPRHERAFHAVIDEIGFAGKHSLRFADYVGRTDRVLWEDFVAAYQPPQSLDTLLEMKRQQVIEVLRSEQPVFEGVPELVKLLGDKVPLALASGSERLIVNEVLAMHGLSRLFKVTVSGSDVANGKPAPDVFWRTASLLGIAPTECVVIEDSRPGVTAALTAGMRVVAITNTHSVEELKGATLVVSDYEELRQALIGVEAKPFPLKCRLQPAQLPLKSTTDGSHHCAEH